MSVSYLASIEQLSVLAHFCGYGDFPLLPELPFINQGQCEAVLKELNASGVVQIFGEEVSVDIGLRFVLHAIAAPELIVQADESLIGYCTQDLGVAVCRDAYKKGWYRITPVPNAEELADYLYSNKKSDCEYSIYFNDGNSKKASFSKSELKAIISQVYMEVQN